MFPVLRLVMNFADLTSDDEVRCIITNADQFSI